MAVQDDNWGCIDRSLLSARAYVQGVHFRKQVMEIRAKDAIQKIALNIPTTKVTCSIATIVIGGQAHKYLFWAAQFLDDQRSNGYIPLNLEDTYLDALVQLERSLEAQNVPVRNIITIEDKNQQSQSNTTLAWACSNLQFQRTLCLPHHNPISRAVGQVRAQAQNIVNRDDLVALLPGIWQNAMWNEGPFWNDLHPIIATTLFN